MVARLEVGILNREAAAIEAIELLDAHLSPEQKSKLQTLKNSIENE
jgi:hypothetical protein